MKTIFLTCGKAVSVDDEDFADLSKFTWSLSAFRYAARKTGDGVEYMHRRIMGFVPGDGRRADHRDGDGLNNVRANLRECTQLQNMQNNKLRRDSESGVKGVHASTHGTFYAYIRYRGKRRHLGSFPTIELAAEFRQLAADMLHGEFANHGVLK